MCSSAHLCCGFPSKGVASWAHKRRQTYVCACMILVLNAAWAMGFRLGAVFYLLAYFDLLASRAHMLIFIAGEQHATCECSFSRWCTGAFPRTELSEQYMFSSACHFQSVCKLQHVRTFLIFACFKQRVDAFFHCNAQQLCCLLAALKQYLFQLFFNSQPKSRLQAC